MEGRPPDIPTVTAWPLTELAEMKGRQELFECVTRGPGATWRKSV